MLPPFRQMLTWAGSHPWWFSTTGTSHNPLWFYLFYFFWFYILFFMRARQDSHPLPLTALQHFIWKANFLWGCGRLPFITSIFTLCHSIMLWSRRYIPPLCTSATLSLRSREKLRQGVTNVISTRCLSLAFFFIILTWALGVRIVNVLSQPHRYHLK